jgi:hypothetical protein
VGAVVLETLQNEKPFELVEAGSDPQVGMTTVNGPKRRGVLLKEALDLHAGTLHFFDRIQGIEHCQQHFVVP